MVTPIIFICGFTFIIHLTESLTYCMRLAGVRTKRVAISMSFVSSSLLISRLSNMFQAPLLGAMVDRSISLNNTAALRELEWDFRLVIFSGFLGSAAGAFLGPTFIRLFEGAIQRFQRQGSLPGVFLSAFRPRTFKTILKQFTFPRLAMLSAISLHRIPKGFLIMNIFVTSIWTIGVLSSLMAGAYAPELRSTASQLSGIVNGMATILFTLFVDPIGARITDDAVHQNRSENDVRSVVFFLQSGRLIGTLLVAQLLFYPASLYIQWVTETLGRVFVW